MTIDGFVQKISTGSLAPRIKKSVGRCAMLLCVAWPLASCRAPALASVIPVVTVDAPRKLRELGPVAVVIPSANGALTLVGTSGLGTSMDQATSAVDLVRRAGDLMRFQLQQIGFQVTADTTVAGAIAEFSVGGVRFDSQRGWLATEAVLLFRRPASRDPVAAFRTSARFAMPGADSLVVGLRRITQSRY